MFVVRFSAWLLAAALVMWAAVGIPSQAVHSQEQSESSDSTGSSQADAVFHPSNTRTVHGIDGQCRQCHAGSAAVEPLPGFPELADDDWILRDEIRTFAFQDKHYQAYVVLLNARSQQIASRMGVVDAQGNSLVHRDKRCLACHSGFPLHQLTPDEELLVEDDLTEDFRFRLTAGVTCEGCHGPSDDGIEGQPGWFSHHTKKGWRFLPAETKQADFGFYNIRSSVSKTQMCLSCHLGNADQGKVLTHEMYAAGHPPLPGFELVTFIDQLPRHWRTLDEKPDAIREAFLKETNTNWDAAHMHRTRDMLVGAICNLSESLKLANDLAQQDVHASVPTPEWPELSQFACYACHHELTQPSWRQNRPAAGTPGRPTLHEWPFALTAVALQAAGTSQTELEQQLGGVQKALHAQPFGRPDQLAGEVPAAVDWLDQKARQLETAPVTAEDAAAILESLTDIAAGQILDYDSARQLVWAFGVVYSDLNGRPSRSGPGVANRWYETADGGSESDLDPVEQRLKALSSMFLLNLRRGTDEEQEVPSDNQPRRITEVDLQQVFPPVGAYDPYEFQKQMAEIQSLLQSP